MNTEKWNVVLLEWVNCLKLYKHINDIEDLRNGEFFINLQKILIRSRDAGHADVLTFIFDLCGRHYPNYLIENKAEIHLSDLSVTDLKAIISLLLHYTCIHDRREALMSPLCHMLTTTTQLIIRNFLEKMTGAVNNETLNEIINSCIDEIHTHPNQCQFLSCETSTGHNSPLQDLLKTPVSKIGRLQEKEKLILKLKSELEAERYEKADAQDELKLQREKNKKLKDQLLQKTSEISRLRSEIVALENRTPPHYQDMDSRDLQHRLRSEINSLEQYIKNSELEYDEIRREKDVAKEQLRKLEVQASLWEDKYFEAERNLEQITENSAKQTEEITNLQLHCAELTALLDEYRSKPTDDSSQYDTFTSVSGVDNLNGSDVFPNENLACSVVEVQLRETQQQLKDVEAELDVFKRKVQEQDVDIENINKKWRETANCVQRVQKENEDLLSRITSYETENHRLENELCAVLDELEAGKKQIQNLVNKVSEAEAVSSQLQFELSDAILDCQKSNMNLANLKDINQQLEEKLKMLQMSNAEIVYYYEIAKQSVVEQKQAFEAQVQKLQQTVDEMTEEKGKLEEKIDEEMMLVSQITEKCRTLEETVHDYEVESQRTKNELSQVCKESEMRKVQIQILKNEMIEIKTMLQQVQSELAPNVIACQKAIASLDVWNKAYQELQDKLKVLEKSKHEIERDYERVKQLVVEQKRFGLQLEQSLKQVEEEKTKLEKKVQDEEILLLEKSEKCRMLEEVMGKYEIDNQRIKNELNRVLEESEIRKNHIDIVEKEITEVNTQCEQLQVELAEKTIAHQEANANLVELNEANQQFQLKLEDLQKSKDEIECRFERKQQSMIEEKENVEIKVERLEQNLGLMTEEREKLKMEIEDKKILLCETTEKCVSLEEMMQDSEADNKRIKEELSQISEEALMQKNQVQILEKEIIEAKALSNKLQFELVKATSGYQKVHSDLAELNDVNQQLLLKLEDSQKSSDEIKRNMQGIIEEKQNLEVNVQTLEQRLEFITEDKDKVEKKIEDEKILHCQTTEKCKTLETTVQNYESENKRLENELHLVLEVLETGKQQIQVHEKEVSETKTTSDRLQFELADMTRDHQKTNACLANLQEENQQLQNKLTDLQKSKEEIERSKLSIAEENRRFDLQLEMLERNLAEMREEKVDLENKIADEKILFLQMTEKCGRLEEKVEEYEVTVASLRSVEDDVNSKITSLELDNQQLNTELRQVLKELEVAKEQIQILENQIVEAKTLSERLQVELNDMTVAYKKADANLSVLSGVNQQLEDNLKVSEASRHELERSNQSNIEQKKHLELQLQGFEQNLKHAEEEKIKLETKIGDEEVSRLQTIEKCKTLETLGQDFKSENQRIENELTQVVKDLEAAKKQICVLEKERNETNRVSNQLQFELTDVTRNYEKTNTNLVELQDVNEQLQNKLNLLQKLKDEVECDYEKIIQSTTEEKLNFEAKVQTLEQNLEHITKEKVKLEKKIENEKSLLCQTSEKCRSLEEIVQDYELTISGLKRAIDSNLETLETLKFDLLNHKSTESLVKREIMNLLKDNNISYEEVSATDFSTFVCDYFRKVLQLKDSEEQKREDLESEVTELKSRQFTTTKLNFLLHETVAKLQLMLNQDEVTSSTDDFDQLQTRVNTLLANVQKLNNEKTEIMQQLQMIKSEKDVVQETKTEIECKLAEERQKVENLRKELECCRVKPDKENKENILGVSGRLNQPKEDDLKKENMLLKRKIVLAENTKNNLERALKELREKQTSKEVDSKDNDQHYKKLLHEYLELKEEYGVLQREAAEQRNQIEDLKVRSATVKLEADDRLLQDLENIRDAYGKVTCANSMLKQETATLKKVIDDLNSERINAAHIKEAYEKLLEENNKLLTDIDTLKYKRTRDKEECVRLLKKEHDEGVKREWKKIQEVRSEYESKLEKMKEKMLKLYREEVHKKVKSTKSDDESALHQRVIADLRAELLEASQKIRLLEAERTVLMANKLIEREVNYVPTATVFPKADKAATLPASIKSEVTSSRGTSVMGSLIGTQDLQMEDEEDLFNEKFLTDLKEGRCTLPGDRATSNRFSELAWRNSMVPPHLKSSYPAETQFTSPTRFKEEDLKTGHVDFDDSLCRLLPGEKPRKKDFGTTSYKRPGPPTPSKNGGRLSLQGNEVHPLREHCETKTPKKSTPSRIKSLFTSRTSSTSTREVSESHGSTTPGRNRRLNIFRRPR